MGLRAATLLAVSLCSASGCTGSSITSCGDEPDVSGAWKLALAPLPMDAGVDAVIPGEIEVDAQLTQGESTDFLGLGHRVYGVLTASDASYFGTITIPHLMMNDGGKSGVVLGCKLTLNVPIATPVSDDNVDQGPLRISLVGQVVKPGEILGGVGSLLRRAADPTNVALGFGWTGMHAQ